MAAWVIGIDRENPEHWGFAKKHEYWDMTVHRPLEPEDTLYFWQAGGSLLGSVEVGQGTFEIPSGTWMPWNEASDNESIRERDFRTRVEATIVIRRGQPLFRRSLPEAYHWKCAVIGAAIEGKLEAAHISR